MDALTYSRGVKTFRKAELLASLLNITVSCNDLESNIQRITNDLDLTRQADSWVITKGLQKFLASRGMGNAPLPSLVAAGCASINTLIPRLEKMIKDYREDIWDGKLINLRQVNILNMIEHLNFWLDYTRMVFDVLVTMNNKNSDPGSILDKVDMRWINGTEAFYREFFAELLKGSRAVIANLEAVPEVPVSESSLSILEATEGKGAVDAVNQGFGIHLITPMFWVGMLWKTINLRRIEQMRRKNEIFAMKISQAINLKGGGEDAILEHRIEVYQNEIIKNQHAIESIEESYA